ncbi:hypothetical protein ACLB2K_011711 [Fragaria x ananassa]
MVSVPYINPDLKSHADEKLTALLVNLQFSLGSLPVLSSPSAHSLLSFTFLSLVPLPTQSAPEAALITQIPGFNGTLPSKHRSGYVTIDERNGRNLFYYFVESERKPSEDPVVLWLNGGPGCSSFDGFVYEHGIVSLSDVMFGFITKEEKGPFNFEAAKTKRGLPKLHLNPYSWSKVSNILYLDSPAGVGLSYSKNKSDYITGDLKTASDSHTFLLKWFELYPEFLSNPFFISGVLCWCIRANTCFRSCERYDDEVATAWLNNAAVRKAIHAEDASMIPNWELCTDNIRFYHDAGSMIPYHKNLTSKGYRALIYSGDHDLCVPFTGSEAWTRSLGYKIVDEWRPWTSEGQIAGYTQGYEKNLTFSTVKGSGHTVPEYKPQEALDLYSRFLAGKPL